MYDYNCQRCGGLVAEPMKPYGYAGRFCHCPDPIMPKANVYSTNTNGTTFIQICTCGQKCPIHEPPQPRPLSEEEK